MALKTLMIRKKIDDANKALETIREAEADFEKREADLEVAITEAETDEERAVCEEEVEKFEAEKAEHTERKQGLEKDLADLEAELAAEEARSEKAVEQIEERKEEKPMDKREMFTEEEMQERAAFVDYVRGIETRDNDYNMTQGNNGAVVPKTIAQEIVTRVKEICPVFEMSSRYSVKGTFEIPYYPYSSSHVVAAAYKNEMDELVASSGDFGTIELTGFLAGALAKISKKLINNTDIDVVPFIVNQMAEAFKNFYEHECLVGTASKATGLLAGIEAGATVAGTYKSFITTDDLISCQCKVPTALQGNCRWVMAPATFEQIRKLKDADNRYYIINMVEGGGYTLLGKPVDLSDNMPALGTTNNKAVVYGDYSGLAVKMTEDLEIQILQEKFATQHAVGVVGWTEIDTKVENAQKFACIKCGTTDPGESE